MMATTHGMRALAVRLNGGARLEKRTTRALAKIQRALTMQPLEHLHALATGHLARFEIILQGYQAHHLANPDAPPTPHMLALANAWRRTAELLAQREVQLADRSKNGRGTVCGKCGAGPFSDLQSYLGHGCSGTNGHAAPPADAASAPVGSEAGE
jgi:hypothetical protein